MTTSALPPVAPRWLGALIATGLVAAHLANVALMWSWSLWLWAPEVLAAACGLLPAAAGAVTRLAGRLVAGLLALAAVVPLWFGFWWAVRGITTSGQTPNPDIADGDPCCSHPDTWTEVVIGFLAGAMLLAGCVALIYIVFRLARFALLGVEPT